MDHQLVIHTNSNVPTSAGRFDGYVKRPVDADLMRAGVALKVVYLPTAVSRQDGDASDRGELDVKPRLCRDGEERGRVRAESKIPSSLVPPKDPKAGVPLEQATRRPIEHLDTHSDDEDDDAFLPRGRPTPSCDRAPTRERDNITNHESHQSSSQPVAGPSNPKATASYITGNYRPWRQSRLYLKGSTTSFIDVTDEIEDVSEHPVSEGGFCDIYVANMRGEGRVALKKLRLLGSHEKAAKRFRYEAEVWFRVNHPNVLKFYGISTVGRCLYMVSPWQENGHMSRYIRTCPNVNRLRLLYQVADALEYLHNHDPRIIHGDIKGSNILISPEGNALLCDFGLSMILSEIAIMSGVPTGVSDGGSIRFMANELMTDGQSKTEASDVYSFAMLMIEAFTGSPPYMQLKNDVAVINAIVGGKRPSYPFTAESGSSHFTTEQRLWRLMQVCWHMKPAVRPSMRNVKACLKMIMHNTTDTPTEVKDTMKGKFLPIRKFVMFNGMSMSECANVLTKPVSKSRRKLMEPNRWWLAASNLLIVTASVAQVGILAALIDELGGSSHVSSVFHLVIPIIGFIIAFLTCATGVHGILYAIYLVRPLQKARNIRLQTYVMQVALYSAIISTLGSLSAALLVTVSSSNGRLRRLDNGRARILLHTYEATCWFIWVLFCIITLYYCYARFVLRRLSKDGQESLKLKCIDPESNTQKDRGVHAKQDPERGSTLYPTARSPSSRNDVEQGGSWPNVELRLQNTNLPSPPPLTEVDISSCLFSGPANSLESR